MELAETTTGGRYMPGRGSTQGALTKRGSPALLGTPAPHMPSWCQHSDDFLGACSAVVDGVCQG